MPPQKSSCSPSLQKQKQERGGKISRPARCHLNRVEGCASDECKITAIPLTRWHSSRSAPVYSRLARGEGGSTTRVEPKSNSTGQMVLHFRVAPKSGHYLSATSPRDSEAPII